MKGDSEKQIARALGVSPHTVHVYVKMLYRYFDVHSKGELLAKAFARVSVSNHKREMRLNRAVEKIGALVLRIDPKAKKSGRQSRQDYDAQAQLKKAVEKISRVILQTQVVKQPSPKSAWGPPIGGYKKKALQRQPVDSK
jgi:hypothetical protein